MSELVTEALIREIKHRERLEARITEAVELLELAKDRDEGVSPADVIAVLMGDR